MQAALAAARLPPEALAVVVADAEAPRKPPPGLACAGAGEPGLVMKLVTTFAALDQLNAATWQTPVYLEGTLQARCRQCLLQYPGRDPKLVVERLWLLLRRLQAQGVMPSRATSCSTAALSAWARTTRRPSMMSPTGRQTWRPMRWLVNYQVIALTFVPDSAAKRRVP